MHRMFVKLSPHIQATYTPRLSTEKSNYWIDACCINQDYQDSYCNASQDEFKNQIQLLEKSNYQFKSTLEKKILSIKICYCWNITIFKQTNNIHTNIKTPSWSKINLPPPPKKKKTTHIHIIFQVLFQHSFHITYKNK